MAFLPPSRWKHPQFCEISDTPHEIYQGKIEAYRRGRWIANHLKKE